MAKRVSKAFGTKRPPAGVTGKVGRGRGTAARNNNTGVLSRAATRVRTLSSQAATAVGRPGFGGFKPGPVDGKLSVRRLMQRDPKKGITQPAADKITTTNVDLVGPVNPRIVAAQHAAAPNAGKRVIRPTRKSKPVYSNKPGRVRRSPGS